jgi:hypothetical protein
MVRPAHRRALVEWVRAAYQLPERRACRAVGVWRSLLRYRSVRPRQEPLRARLHDAQFTFNTVGFALVRKDAQQKAGAGTL